MSLFFPCLRINLWICFFLTLTIAYFLSITATLCLACFSLNLHLTHTGFWHPSQYKVIFSEGWSVHVIVCKWQKRVILVINYTFPLFTKQNIIKISNIFVGYHSFDDDVSSCRAQMNTNGLKEVLKLTGQNILS